MDHTMWKELSRRLGPERLKQRLGLAALQKKIDWPHKATGLRRVQYALPSLLRPLGLLDRGQANALNICLERNQVASPHIPTALDGLRLLHLSDLHLDSMADQGQRLKELVARLNYDLCVITGDFLFAPGALEAQQENMRQLTQSLCPCLGTYAVLGNHDYIECVPWLESLGIRVLLNEGLALARGKGILYLAGVDDPTTFATHDTRKALAGRVGEPQDIPFTLFLCHSPALAREAETYGVDFYLCGHTHGGQICLPGGIPMVTKTACPRHLTSGSWRLGNMAGYTSRGAGSALPAIRFYCPPEITLHVLEKTSGA